MDILKMLMIYMSTTLAFSLQAAPTPAVTPEPTAVVTEAPTATPEPEEEVTITPAPTETPTATPAPTVSTTPVPVPTITPNIKGYRNLAQGAKGAEVRKLQERLIELGYLPEGSADGAYGGKTRNAVRKFQYYNGLTVDGVAGRATQTNLFENPDAAPMPSASPAPTETPSPTPEDTATPSPTPTLTPTPTKAPTPEPDDGEGPIIGDGEDEEETPEPEATETPEPEATGTPTAGPTATPITVEEFVDLDANGYEDIEGSVALNESGAPLEWNALEDGVTVKKTPRLQRKEDRIRVSLDDLAECLPDWVMTEDENGTLVLEAEGYTIAIFDESEGPSATVDGVDVEMTEEDFDFLNEGRFIDSQLLARLFRGEAVWVPEEKTLMLTIPGKIRSGATD